jgi:uncharacterized membrane protein YfcA
VSGPEGLPIIDMPLALALVAIGFAGGVVSVLVSLASLVTYPAMLALGLPPVSANVTNTVALTFNAVGAGFGSRQELAGQASTLRRLAVIAVAGGSTGAALLLALPGRTFELVVPVLVGAASLVILVEPSLRKRERFQPRGLTPLTAAAYFAAATYIGYFGAAGGILVLVVLGGVIDRPLHHVNAAKAVLSGVTNGTAAIGFCLFGPVRWAFVLPLAAGMLMGGYVGPAIARRLPVRVLRGLVAVCGLVVAAALARSTYGLG